MYCSDSSSSENELYSSDSEVWEPGDTSDSENDEIPLETMSFNQSTIGSDKSYTSFDDGPPKPLPKFLPARFSDPQLPDESKTREGLRKFLRIIKSDISRISPIRNCTLKEYDQQISDLKKENFSLKMRIYYMEDKMQQKFGDGQDIHKMNVEHQVEIDYLKQELMDKQVLVQKAALAIETLTVKYEDELKTTKNQLQESYEKMVMELQNKLDKANRNCSDSQKKVEEAKQKLEVLKHQLNNTRAELVESNKTKEELSRRVKSQEREAISSNKKPERTQINEYGAEEKKKIDVGTERFPILQGELVTPLASHPKELMINSIVMDRSQQNNNINTSQTNQFWETSPGVAGPEGERDLARENDQHNQRQFQAVVNGPNDHSPVYTNKTIFYTFKGEKCLNTGDQQNSSLTDDTEEGLGKHAENHHSFQHALFLDDHFDYRRQDRASSVIFDSSISPWESNAKHASSTNLNSESSSGNKECTGYVSHEDYIGNINSSVTNKANVLCNNKAGNCGKDSDNNKPDESSVMLKEDLPLSNGKTSSSGSMHRTDQAHSQLGKSTIMNTESRNAVSQMHNGDGGDCSNNSQIKKPVSPDSLPKNISGSSVSGYCTRNMEESTNEERSETIGASVLDISTVKEINNRNALAEELQPEKPNNKSVKPSNEINLGHYEGSQQQQQSHCYPLSIVIPEMTSVEGKLTMEHHQLSEFNQSKTYINKVPISQIEERPHSVSKVGGAARNMLDEFSDKQPSLTLTPSPLSRKHQHFSDFTPPRRGKLMAVADDHTNMQQQLIESQCMIKCLEKKLQATENTVRLLSKKNQVYLSTLNSHGLSQSLISRSNSETCLDMISGSPDRRVSSVGNIHSFVCKPRGQDINESNSNQELNQSIERARGHFVSNFGQSVDLASWSPATNLTFTPCVAALSSPETTRNTGRNASFFSNQTQANFSNPAVSPSIIFQGNASTNIVSSGQHNTSSPLTNTTLLVPATINGNVAFSPHDQHFKKVLYDSHSKNLSNIYSEGSACMTSETTNSRHTVKLHGNRVGTQGGNVNGYVMEHLFQNGNNSSDRDANRDPGTGSLRPSNSSSDNMHRSSDVTCLSNLESSLLERSLEKLASQSSQRQTTNQSAGRQATNQSPQPKTQSLNNKSSEIQSQTPNVTYSSILDGSLVTRLLANLEQSLISPKGGTSDLSNLSEEQLKMHAEHLERVHITLREELRIYEALYHFQETEDTLILSEGIDKGIDTPNVDLLKQHLFEIRQLRQRLERLDASTGPDHLLIFQSHTNQRISHLEKLLASMQQLTKEKEEKWQRDLSDLEHKLCQEKTLLGEKLELAVEIITEQEKQAPELKSQLHLEEAGRKKEMERKILKHKSELESNMMVLDKDIDKSVSISGVAQNSLCLDYMRLDGDTEEYRKQLVALKAEVEESTESLRSLKEKLVRNEGLLEEKIVMIRKLTTEKAACDVKLEEKERQLEKVKQDLHSLKKEMQEMKNELEEKDKLRAVVDILKEELEERENAETKMKEQIADYESELNKITKETTHLRKQLVSVSEENVRLKLEVNELEHKLTGKSSLETQVSQLKEHITYLSSLQYDTNRLTAVQNQKNLEEVEKNEQMVKLQEEVEMLRGKQDIAQGSIRVGEDLIKNVTGDVNELEEKLTTRKKQLHHLLGKYRKLEGAFIKQQQSLKEKLELIQNLKKQMHLYEVSLTCSSEEEKDSTMKHLIKELISTQRQVEDLLSKLEQTSAEFKTPIGRSFDEQRIEQHKLDPETRLSSNSGSSLALHHHSPFNQIVPSRQKIFVAPTKDMALQVNIGSEFHDFKQDSHNNLQKVIEECLTILSGMETKLNQRLRVYMFQIENNECRTIKDIIESCQKLHVFLEKAAHLSDTARIPVLPFSNTGEYLCGPEQSKFKREAQNKQQSHHEVFYHTSNGQQSTSHQQSHNDLLTHSSSGQQSTSYQQSPNELLGHTSSGQQSTSWQSHNDLLKHTSSGHQSTSRQSHNDLPSHTLSGQQSTTHQSHNGLLGHTSSGQQSTSYQQSYNDLLGHTSSGQQTKQNITMVNSRAWETVLYRQLFKTAQNLEQAKKNFDSSLSNLPRPPPSQ